MTTFDDMKALIMRLSRNKREIMALHDNLAFDPSTKTITLNHLAFGSMSVSLTLLSSEEAFALWQSWRQGIRSIADNQTEQIINMVKEMVE